MVANKTYTYTARNVDDFNRIVTFTLQNGDVRVGLPGLVDQVGSVAGSEDKADEFKRQAFVQARPALLRIREGISGPVNISDVNARLNGDRLHVTMWPRMGGLRLAPVRINMGQIDNQEAAEAFVEELEKRKEDGEDARRFLGPLDYWIGWAGLLLVIGFFIRKPNRDNQSEESE